MANGSVAVQSAMGRCRLEEDYDTIIIDVLTDETAAIYKQKLKKFKPHIVLLLPTLDEIKRRSKLRKEWLTSEEIEMLYQWQELFTSYDTKIDFTSLNLEIVVHRLKEFYK